MTTAAQIQAFFGTLPTVSSEQGAYGAYRLEGLPASRLGPLVADANRGWLPVEGTTGGYRVTGNPAKGTWLESVNEFAIHNAPVEEKFILEYTPNYFGSSTAEKQAVAANDKESAIVQGIGMAITGAGLSGAFGGQSLWSSVSSTPAASGAAVIDEAAMVRDFSASLAPSSSSSWWTSLLDPLKQLGTSTLDGLKTIGTVLGAGAAISNAGKSPAKQTTGGIPMINVSQVPGGVPDPGATPPNVNTGPAGQVSPLVLILGLAAAALMLGG